MRITGSPLDLLRSALERLGKGPLNADAVQKAAVEVGHPNPAHVELAAQFLAQKHGGDWSAVNTATLTAADLSAIEARTQTANIGACLLEAGEITGRTGMGYTSIRREIAPEISAAMNGASA